MIRLLFFFSSRRRHTRWNCDWSSDVCSSDLIRDSANNSYIRCDDAERRKLVDIDEVWLLGEEQTVNQRRDGEAHVICNAAQSRGIVARVERQPRDLDAFHQLATKQRYFIARVDLPARIVRKTSHNLDFVPALHQLAREHQS